MNISFDIEEINVKNLIEKMCNALNIILYKHLEFDGSYAYRLISKDSREIGVSYLKSYYSYSTWRWYDLNILLKELICSIVIFKTSKNDIKIENPYLGCRSLEEIKIKLDLMGYQYENEQ